MLTPTTGSPNTASSGSSAASAESLLPAQGRELAATVRSVASSGQNGEVFKVQVEVNSRLLELTTRAPLAQGDRVILQRTNSGELQIRLPPAAQSTAATGTSASTTSILMQIAASGSTQLQQLLPMNTPRPAVIIGSDPLPGRQSGTTTLATTGTVESGRLIQPGSTLTPLPLPANTVASMVPQNTTIMPERATANATPVLPTPAPTSLSVTTQQPDTAQTMAPMPVKTSATEAQSLAQAQPIQTSAGAAAASTQTPSIPLQSTPAPSSTPASTGNGTPPTQVSSQHSTQPRPGDTPTQTAVTRQPAATQPPEMPGRSSPVETQTQAPIQSAQPSRSAATAASTQTSPTPSQSTPAPSSAPVPTENGSSPAQVSSQHSTQSRPSDTATQTAVTRQPAATQLPEPSSGSTLVERQPQTEQTHSSLSTRAKAQIYSAQLQSMTASTSTHAAEGKSTPPAQVGNPASAPPRSGDTATQTTANIRQPAGANTAAGQPPSPPPVPNATATGGERPLPPASATQSAGGTAPSPATSQPGQTPSPPPTATASAPAPAPAPATAAAQPSQTTNQASISLTGQTLLQTLGKPAPAQPDNHMIRLSINNQTLNLVSPKPMLSGQQVLLTRVAEQQVSLQTLPPVSTPAQEPNTQLLMQQALREALPRQIPFADALNQLVQLSQTPAVRSQGAIGQLVQSMLSMFSVSPGSADAEQAIQRNLQQGGLLTESRLAQGGTTAERAATPDLKQQLGQLMKAAEQLPPDARQQMSRLIESLQARSTTQQIGSLQGWKEQPDGTQERMYRLDLPIRQASHHENAELTITEQRRRGSTGELETFWGVALHFDLEQHGSVDARLSLSDGWRLQVQFWAEQAPTLRQIEKRLAEFSDGLHRKGFLVETLQARQGRPSQPELTDVQRRLVDVHT